MIVHYVKFKNGETSLLAFGSDQDDLPLYREYEPGRFEVTSSRFPNCGRFMPYATLEERGEVASVAEVEAKFGRVWTASMRRRELQGEEA